MEGLAGLYNGLAPKICGNLLSTIAAQKCTEFLKLSEPDSDETDIEEEESEEQR